MSFCRTWLMPLLVLASSRSLVSQGADPPASPTTAGPQLTLPPRCYAVADLPLSISFDNLILQEQPGRYRLEFHRAADGTASPLGTLEERRWTWTPSADEVGKVPLVVSVSDRETNQRIASAATTVEVAPADAGAGARLSLLIVGDSLTSRTLYPNELARLLSSPGNPRWQMFGTHRPENAAPGVAHEGYGSWTWEMFASRHVEKPDPPKRQFSSPFVFIDAAGAPRLDMATYFDRHNGGRRPNVMTFLLGINDCFSAPPDDRHKIDERIDQMFHHADTVLAEARRVAPEADLVIGLVPPPNAREEAFVANYRDRYTRWGWKRIQHRLVQRQLEHYGRREAEGVFVIPTELGVDPVDGFPVDDAVHPNAVGYRQIAETIYAWLKWRMADGARTP